MVLFHDCTFVRVLPAVHTTHSSLPPSLPSTSQRSSFSAILPTRLVISSASQQPSNPSLNSSGQPHLSLFCILLQHSACLPAPHSPHSCCESSWHYWQVCAPSRLVFVCHFAKKWRRCEEPSQSRQGVCTVALLVEAYQALHVWPRILSIVTKRNANLIQYFPARSFRFGEKACHYCLGSYLFAGARQYSLTVLGIGVNVLLFTGASPRSFLTFLEELA